MTKTILITGSSSGLGRATAKHFKIRRQFDVNVLGVLATTKALLPHFRANRSGVIVNISSGGGRVTLPLGTLYHGTKFAVEGLSESLHFELAPLGVRVKIVEPGAIKTDFMSRSLDFSNDPQLSEYQPLVQKVLAVIGPMMEQGAPPERVAESVYPATTDDSNQLRYEVGVDVVELLESRRSMDDASFLGGMRTQCALFDRRGASVHVLDEGSPKMSAMRCLPGGKPSGEARRGKGSMRFGGYKEHLARDLDHPVIVSCAVTPANRPEEEGAAPMAEDVQRQRPRLVELHIDRAYVNSLWQSYSGR
ncbi:SDR family NAD(P)-dependent oxidoreductase [Sorangium cellulosum]|nr:SDR family NAD(P)-dependent oxidoreductase [Sorangium cellulosum]